MTRSIYHYEYAYVRQTQCNWKKETKIIKLDKGKERNEKKAKKNEKEKGR